MSVQEAASITQRPQEGASPPSSAVGHSPGLGPSKCTPDVFQLVLPTGSFAPVPSVVVASDGQLLFSVVQMAPSVPRKFRAQWNMGIIQAKEALNMPVEERMANFLFLYDDKGPRLNPHIMEKLKPEASLDGDPEFRAQPDLPSQPADPLGDLTAQFSNSTSAEMKGAVSSKEMLHPPAESQVRRARSRRVL